MPTIRNNGTVTPLSIASGYTIDPGASRQVPVALWARVSQSRVVRGWLASGKLSVEEAAGPTEPDDRTDEEREKDALIEKLAAHGIERTRRTSLDSLTTQLAKAEADAKGGTF